MAGVGVGGGAVAFARYAMNQANHRLKVANDTRKAGLKARRAFRRSMMDKGEDFEDVEIPNRVEFDCFYLCERCKYMAATQATPCPVCGATMWVDLADLQMGHTLRDLEEIKRRKVSPQVHAIVSLLYLVLMGLGGIVTGIVTDSGYGYGTATLLFFLFLVTYSTTVRWWSVLLERFRFKRPRRWRFPIPIPNTKLPPRQTVTGQATGEPMLKAPFSGLPCIGYKATVLFDVENDARPPEWAVAEVECGDLQVDGVSLHGASTHLDTDMTFIDETTLCTDFDLTRYLRQRGLFAYDGEFWLYESRIEPGTPVTAQLYSQGSDSAVVTNVV